MSNVDTRQVNRDSLLLLAQVRVPGNDQVHQIKVRNLSVGGMMAEGLVNVARGSSVQVELRNIGWVDGSVAWKQDDRFGIAFVEEIDAILVRAPATEANESPGGHFTRLPIRTARGPDPTRVRKV